MLTKAAEEVNLPLRINCGYLVENLVYQAHVHPLHSLDLSYLYPPDIYIALVQGPFWPPRQDYKLTKDDAAYLENFKYGVLTVNDNDHLKVKRFPSLKEARAYFDNLTNKYQKENLH